MKTLDYVVYVYRGDTIVEALERSTAILAVEVAAEYIRYPENTKVEIVKSEE